jgi:transcriptional regulator with XRE-family HTH domain
MVIVSGELVAAAHDASMEITDKFACNVRKYRRDRNLSQEELAHRAGIHRTYVWELERTGRRNPSLKVAQAIADALEISLADLVAEPDAEYVKHLALSRGQSGTRTAKT